MFHTKTLKLAPALLLAVVLSSFGFGQKVEGVVSPPVAGKNLIISSFDALIKKTIRQKPSAPPHQRPTLPAGVPNGLVAGEGVTKTTPALAGFYFPTIGYTGAEPPDPDIAVSESHVVVTVNSSIAFYTKTGTQVFQQDSTDFFASVSNVGFQFDPKIVYDHVAKRFIMVFLALDQAGSKSFILLAVSNGANPMNGWKLYNLDVTQTEGGSSFWLDYPGLGFDNKTVAFSGNMFGFTSGYNGVQFIALDKTTLYGGTATMVKFKASGGTAQLAKQSGTLGDTLYGLQSESTSSLKITAITNTGSIALQQMSLPVPTWTRAAGGLAGPDGKQVDTINDGRIFTGSWRNGRMVGGHVVGSAGNGSLPCSRWYDVRTNNWPTNTATPPTLAQSGNIVAPAGHGYTFPALSIDKNGSIGATFSKIGTTTSGDVMVAGRKPSDPPGTMGSQIVLEAAKVNQNNNFSDRWGDYFDLELDPVDNVSMWSVGMGPNAQGRWQTYVKSFSVSVPDASLDKTLPGSASVNAGRIQSGDRVSLFSEDSNNLVVRSEPVRGLGQIAGTTMLFTLPYTTIDSLRVTYSVAGVPGASASVFALNHLTGNYEVIDTIGLSTSRQSKTTELLPAARAKYVSSLGSMNITIRATLPVRSGRMPGAFSLAIDRVNVLTSRLN
jgi:hypothetical protein